MTGFARASGENHDRRWTWEAKSVNGRSLDVRIKVPYGYDRIELPAKKLAGDRLGRGSISLTLYIESKHANSKLRINRPFLDELIELHDDFANRVDSDPLKLEALLTVKGVIETADSAETSEDMEQTDIALLSTLDAAIDGLAASRREEGERLNALLADCLTSLKLPVRLRGSQTAPGSKLSAIASMHRSPNFWTGRRSLPKNDWPKKSPCLQRRRMFAKNSTVLRHIARLARTSWPVSNQSGVDWTFSAKNSIARRIHFVRNPPARL